MQLKGSHRRGLEKTSLEVAQTAGIHQALDETRTQLAICKSKLDKHEDLHRITQELRGVIQTQTLLTAQSATTAQDLRAMQTINAELREQITQTRRSLSEALANNENLSRQLENALRSESAIMDQSAKTQSDCNYIRLQLSQQLTEADEFSRFLGEQVDELLDDLRLARREQEWADALLNTSSQQVSELLGELSEQETARQKLEEKVINASTRASAMNRWLLNATRKDLEQSEARYDALTTEMSSLREQLSECEVEIATLRSTKCNTQTIDELSNDMPVSTAMSTSCSGDPAQPSMSTGAISSHTIMEDMFPALSGRQPDLGHIKKQLGIRNICVVVPDDFVWVSCPDAAFFVKPLHCQGKGTNMWKICKNKSVKRLQRESSYELVPYFSGAYYYVGSYSIGEAERLSIDEFEQLPEKVLVVKLRAELSATQSSLAELEDENMKLKVDLRVSEKWTKELKEELAVVNSTLVQERCNVERCKNKILENEVNALVGAVKIRLQEVQEEGAKKVAEWDELPVRVQELEEKARLFELCMEKLETKVRELEMFNDNARGELTVEEMCRRLRCVLQKPIEYNKKKPSSVRNKAIQNKPDALNRTPAMSEFADPQGTSAESQVRNEKNESEVLKGSEIDAVDHVDISDATAVISATKDELDPFRPWMSGSHVEDIFESLGPRKLQRDEIANAM
ncbi:uncharacterized protein FIBRA_02312 [Fibroporia radiculosa]|uniref:Uncharacterized protein n=1 Tax=Fibroporia radiculosa TaxID=599839 RepID=J4HUQ1_9APHY|nr:uncharacterized protein FIBRA_02312 [Fibroporia radiculosa]CCM00282.1 predicted protein [Fibroporia radiculosa]